MHENFIKNISSVGIILDGADQSGKSTLAERLGKLIQTNYYHYDPPKNVHDWVKEYTKFLKYETKDAKVLVDRCYLSEMVYGPIFRTHSGVDSVAKMEIENILQERKYIYVLCHREDFGEHNFDYRNELYDFEGIMKARDSFVNEFEKVNLPKIRVNPFDGDDAIKTILAFMSEAYAEEK